MSYDKLIIATGARSRRPNIPGSDARNIFTLKDLQDGIGIRNYVDEKKQNEPPLLVVDLLFLKHPLFVEEICWRGISKGKF